MVPESILDHTGDEPIEDRAVHLKAGVGVYLDQPGVKFSIDHEIKPKYFEVVAFPLGINEAKRRLNGICSNFLDFGIDISLEVEGITAVSGQRVEVSLQFVVGKFISELILAIIDAIFLDGIVGQVDLVIIDVLQTPEIAGGSDVTVLVPIPSYFLVVD